MYTSLHASDYTFFAKVLFCIDSAIQTHWKSCRDSEDRESVNDRVLLVQDQHDMILRHSFTQQIPRIILDKIPHLDESTKQGTGGGGQGKGKGGKDKNHLNNDKKDIITDDDKKHLKWRVRPGENFTKIFYFNQKLCPKNKDGKLLCMKYFLRGFCDASCSRIHKLTSDDEKAFDKFVSDCRATNEEEDKSDF
jgi:hypothetical protein